MQANSSSHERPDTASRHWLSRAAMLVATGLWAVLWGVGTRRLWSQGGYLHLAFAQSLAEDRGYGVGGRLIFGDASPLWVALLAGCHAGLGVFAVDWLVAGKVLSVLTALFFAAGLYRLTQALVANSGSAARLFTPALVVFVVGLSPYWGVEAFCGSEVLAAAGVACWGCALVSGRLTAAIRPSRLLAACVCAGCGPLLRPEMLFLSVCLAPFLFVRWVNTPLRFGRRVVLFFTGLALAVGPGAGWLLYTVRKFGTALPNTVSADAAAPGVSVLGQGIARLAVGAPWLPLALAGFGGWLLKRYLDHRRGSPAGDDFSQNLGGVLAKLDPGVWLPLVWAGLATSFYLVTHTAVTSREVLLLAPACTASIFAGMNQFRPRLGRGVGAVCAVYGVSISLLLPWRGLPVEGKRERVYADLSGILRKLPARDRVALAPVGEVMFLSAHPVADLGGVLDATATSFRWDAADGRRVWWAHGQGARLMLLDHAPEPGSTAVWSSDLPTDLFTDPFTALFSASFDAAGGNRPGGSHSFDRLTLWRLPPSPTLPQPSTLLDSPG